MSATEKTKERCFNIICREGDALGVSKISKEDIFGLFFVRDT